LRQQELVGEERTLGVNDDQVLGLVGGRINAAVAQNHANLVERNTVSQHLCSCGMSTTPGPA